MQLVVATLNAADKVFHISVSIHSTLYHTRASIEVAPIRLFHFEHDLVTLLWPDPMALKRLITLLSTFYDTGEIDLPAYLGEDSGEAR